MLTAIVSIITVILIALLWGQQYKKKAMINTHLIRCLSAGVAGLVIAAMGNTAVATHRLMLGLGGAVVISEALYVFHLCAKHKTVKWIADTLPVVVPILIFFAYQANVTLFFGYDRAIFFYALVVVISYLSISRFKSPTLDRVVSGVISLASLLPCYYGWLYLL